MCSLGEGCSHVAAILFKVEFAVRNGYTSVTSQECSWNQYTKIVGRSLTLPVAHHLVIVFMTVS